MNILALVPARAGSKGIERKNLAPFCGKPLMEHSLDTAAACLEAGLVSFAAVTTDHLELWSRESSRGVVGILRPAELCTDTSPVIDAVRHAVDYLEKFLKPHAFDAVLLLQPTNPLRNLDDIRGAIALLEAHPEADSVISHIPARCHPARMRYLGAGLYYGARVPLAAKAEFSEATQGTARQQLPPVIQRTGEIYLTRTKQIREGTDLEGSVCVPWMQDPARAWDIDEPVDLVIAEALWRAANGPAN